LGFFASDSLIWKPDFEHVEPMACKALGWCRSFSLDIVRWRATLQQPGLMIALAYSGGCHGVAFRLSEGDDDAQMLRLLRREAGYKALNPLDRSSDEETGRQEELNLALFESIESGAHWKQAIEASQNRMSKLGMDGFKNPLP
jgi:cation transport regulator ChaC